jgi:hypothetical protein
LLVVVVLLGLAVLSVVPLLGLMIVHAEGLLDSMARTRRRMRKARERVLPEPVGPPVEKIATDLRRIGAAREEVQLASLGYTILTTQYDKQLAFACRALGVEHRLGALCGFDLDMERLRVETALAEAGLVLHTSDVEQGIDG